MLSHLRKDNYRMRGCLVPSKPWEVRTEFPANNLPIVWKASYTFHNIIRWSNIYLCRSHYTQNKTHNIPSWKVKVKVTLVQALRLCTGRTVHRGSRGIALLFNDHGTRRWWVVSSTARPLFTPGKTQYPLYRRLGGPQGRSGQARKISPLPGFDPRNVQPVASPYINWATRPIFLHERS